MDLYTPYVYNGKTLLIEQYLLLGEQECAKEAYDLFDMAVNPFAAWKLAEIAQNGYAGYDVFEDRSREGFNTFQYRPNLDNKKMFLYAEITSRTKTTVLLCLICSKYGKIWLNGKCLAIFHFDRGTYYISGMLSKGKNTILVEMYAPDDASGFSVQLNNCRFEQGDDFKSLSNMKALVNRDAPIPIHDSFYTPEADTFRFMYMLSDTGKFNPDYRIDIHDSTAGFVKTIPAKINEPVDIDASELRGLSEDTVRHDWLGCVFTRPDGTEFATGLCIFTKNFYSRADELAAECLSLARQLPQEAENHPRGLVRRLKGFREKGDDNGSYWMSWQMKLFADQANSGVFPYEIYKTPGMHEFYIHSDLDDSSIMVLSRIPAEYDGRQVFPVILALATANEGNFSWMSSSENILNDYLVFDVTGRGFTGGSYIGESSTMEVIGWIFKHFSVDRERVYVLGNSNGGFATWALAQNHPHIPAAIYPHTGYPAIETIENASTIPAYQMVSPKDHVFIGRTREVKNRLMPYGNYTQYDFREMLHHHFSVHMAHPGVMENLTSHRRNLWPERILYRTPRNRHLESFWIKLHGIARGRYAGIDAQIDSPRRLSLRLRNTDGVTVTLPPQIDKSGFEIAVNGHTISFADYGKPAVILRKEKGAWREADAQPVVDVRKGTGLLDIYMNSLRVLVPDGCAEALMNVARKFSVPFSNGAYPEIYAEYPVYTESDVPDHIFRHNLLLPETAACPNPYVRRFADKLPVQCDAAGYTYGGSRTDGNYVVMQVIPNPYDPRRTFLVITANDEALLQKHMLLRKVIIPTYTNGLHPLWNNEILVFDGKRYLAAYVPGDALLAVNSPHSDRRVSPSR